MFSFSSIDSDSSDIDNTSEISNNNPTGYTFYFPTYKITTRTHSLLKAFRLFFEPLHTSIFKTTKRYNKKRIYVLNVEDVSDVQIRNQIVNQTLESIRVMQLVMHWIDGLGDDERAVVRICNYPRVKRMKKLKASLLDRFICIRGTVLRSGDIGSLVKEMRYKCVGCGIKIYKKFEKGKCRFPDVKDCDCGKYVEGRKKRKKSVTTRYIPIKTEAILADFQIIKLQESQNMGTDIGSVPKTVEVELCEDLVGTCVCGDHVEVCGIISVMTIHESTGKGYRRKNQIEAEKKFIYIDAISVTRTCNLREKGDTSALKYGELDTMKMEPLAFITFAPKEIQGIDYIKSRPNLFRLIVNSLCPNIIGLEIIKAGLCMALFGGITKFTNTQGKIQIRGDSHVLLVGDPGLGKSQLLLSCSKIAPRGVYVCSRAATSRGLTVIMSRDETTGDFAMEAGALVLSDEGICCIDEFDKLSKDDHKALLESMEQQKISVAKAGICTYLNSRCSVIAAANPVGGKYNRAKTVGENINIIPAMLSRFDLVFVLMDKSVKEKDILMSKHILKFHETGIKDFNEDRSQWSNIFEKDNVEKEAKKNVFNVGIDDNEYTKQKLYKRLSLGDRREEFDPIPLQLLKKYIAYAKKNCKPRLSLEAKFVLKKFFISLRRSYQDSQSTPITTRQLESLVRLAEARARIECRDVVTEKDAWDVIEIMKESFYDMLITETGNLDFRRSSFTVKDKESKRFLRLLEIEANRRGNSLFTLHEMRDIMKNNCIVPKNGADIFLERLNNQGFLLMKGNRKYQLSRI